MAEFEALRFRDQIHLAPEGRRAEGDIFKGIWLYGMTLLVVIRLTCTRARELCETRIYIADTAAENRRIKHPSRINTAYVPLRVIFVPVDSDAYRQTCLKLSSLFYME
jgi:hypothetical protein